MRESDELVIFLGGDIMLGRGIDQILARPSDWRIFEGYIRDARDYVALAEQVSGKIPLRVAASYIWGDGLQALSRHAPEVAIVNLETSITVSDDKWPGKGIHYRMQPSNINCLQAAHIDCCVLANNHVADWGLEGLRDTLAALHGVGIDYAGAGADLTEAEQPAVLTLQSGGRVLVFAYGFPSSGIPSQWGAAADQPGVNLLPSVSAGAADKIVNTIGKYRNADDVVVVSLHWGGNWGYDIPPAHIEFAHALADSRLVNVIHGHSSHHPIGIEVYRGVPILFGCGDLINDYEGIGGHEAYRANLVLMYWLHLQRASGTFCGLSMTPFKLEKFRLNNVAAADAAWLARTLTRASREFGTQIVTDHGVDLRVVSSEVVKHNG